MAIITKIESQKKNNDRVNIYVDGEFFMAVFTELIYTFNLKKGMEIDQNNLTYILKEEMYIKAKNKALNILSKADQSEKKIREKLSAEFEEDTIDIVIEFLLKNKFIDDDLLAQKIVNTNVNLNKCGRNKIKQNLYNKGIAIESINEAISEIDKDIEFENAMYLAKKRYERVKNEDKRKIYQKISQHLAYKGFEEDTIDIVIEFLLKNKFIDDDLLAQKIVNTNVNLNKCGRNKIKQNLYNKGICIESINEAISEIDKDVEFENAMYLAKKRYERVKNEDKRKIYQKISQHLAYKGFDYDIIKRVLNKLLNFDEYDF